jgi:hypothetical protein
MLLRLLKSMLRPRPRQPAAAAAAPRTAAKRPPPEVWLQNPELIKGLASLASGREVEISGAAKEDGSSAKVVVKPGKQELPIGEIISRAASLRGARLSPALEARVRGYEAAFAGAARPGSGPNVFVYHVDMPGNEAISYVDVKFFPDHFDYVDILRRCIERVRSHCPGATVYLVTAPGSTHRALAAADVALVELEVDPRHPMFERATALLAYLRSPAFARDTLFLDADALVNRPLEDVFALGFDIGLTYREAERLMPVNEGVMFFSARRPERVRGFFESRLATYEALAADPYITGFYGDVKRWRGGQLSLNALAHDLRPYSPYRGDEAAGARLRFLPCDTFNFAGGEGESSSAIERLDERFVVHFKGMRKYAFVYAAQAEQAASRVS